jgi:hypothetical protein
MICHFNKDELVWFKTEQLVQKPGIIIGWIYDIWYVIKDIEKGIIYWVYPEFITN